MLIQIARQILKPGGLSAYGTIEAEIAKECRALGCPNPYLALETRSGPKEVWFINCVASDSAFQEIVNAYAANAPLMAALERGVKRKEPFVEKTLEEVAADKSNPPLPPTWDLRGHRYLVIDVTSTHAPTRGPVFETKAGTRLVIRFAKAADEADSLASSLGPIARSLAVRPEWSFPSDDWVRADPSFWSR